MNGGILSRMGLLYGLVFKVVMEKIKVKSRNIDSDGRDWDRNKPIYRLRDSQKKWFNQLNNLDNNFLQLLYRAVQ